MDTSYLWEKYELIVGLEVHAQLLTASKAYAPDSTEYGMMPNASVSVITLAHPGTLPKFNQKVAQFAIKMGLACNCEINLHNTFDRKNYFYPDLPKGYQITQDKQPICKNGLLTLRNKDNETFQIRLNRIHMEEDTGKSLHLAEQTETLLDLNRAGVPLIEIVTEPDFREPEQAYIFLSEIRKLLRYLEICDGNMEEGSLRCDANISLRLRGQSAYGTKVEVKNMNSMRNVQRAITYEFERIAQMLEKDEKVVSETRNFDAASGTTSAMRSKEGLNDYRYFPEPDLPAFILTQADVLAIAEQMPPLPDALYHKFTNTYGLPTYDANVLTESKEIALFFENLCGHTAHFKAASNWVMGPVKSYLNMLTLSIDRFPLGVERLAEIIALVEDGKVSFAMASQKLFDACINQPEQTPTALAEALGLIQQSDQSFILPIVEEVIARFPDKVQAYKAGKTGLLGMFMGEVMKATGGKADPKVASELVRKALEN